MSEKPQAWLAVRRVLAPRCPQRAQGRRLSSLLRLRPAWQACACDNAVGSADDALPYLVFAPTQHVILSPEVLERAGLGAGNAGVPFAIWLPLITAMTVVALPFMKSVVPASRARPGSLAAHRRIPPPASRIERLARGHGRDEARRTTACRAARRR